MKIRVLRKEGGNHEVLGTGGYINHLDDRTIDWSDWTSQFRTTLCRPSSSIKPKIKIREGKRVMIMAG